MDRGRAALGNIFSIAVTRSSVVEDAILKLIVALSAHGAVVEGTNKCI
jgi:hypothetical protein